jgi:hypothetical protein
MKLQTLLSVEPQQCLPIDDKAYSRKRTAGDMNAKLGAGLTDDLMQTLTHRIFRHPDHVVAMVKSRMRGLAVFWSFSAYPYAYPSGAVQIKRPSCWRLCV